MSKGDFRKPIKNKQYIKSDAELSQTEDEADHQFRVEAAYAAEDYSVKGDVELSDAELLRQFRVSMTSNILPNLPKIEGYHLCWIPAQSNNQYDTIDFRKRVGYSVVKPEEVPGFHPASNRAGDIDGCVSYNELILMKIPVRLYQLYMKESHHTQPLEQERAIKQTISAMEDKDGQNIARDQNEMTGINNLARKVAEPTFI